MVLSEAEKRKLLRERRAAKLNNTKERLSKITGERISGENSVNDEEVIPIESKVINDLTSKPASSNSEKESKLSKRISQSFSDPEDVDISKFTPDKSIVHTEEDEEFLKEQQNFENSLKELLRSQEHLHNSTDAGDTGNPFPGFGTGNEADLLQQLLGGGNNGSLNPFLGGEGFNNKEPISDGNIQYQKDLIAYQKLVNDQFKAKFLLMKFVLFTILTLLNYKGFITNRRFVEFFSSFEIVLITLYGYYSSKFISDSHSESKILNFLELVPDQFVSRSIKNKVKLGFKYFETLQFILFDLSVVIVIFGFLSFI